jgi:methionine-rich copper-binding protein CopC
VVSGSGSKVTDAFTLPAGKYRMSWTTQGHDNFIVTLHYPSGQTGLINQIPPEPASGQAYVESGGGSHFLEVQAATLNWSMTFASLAGDQLNAATPPAPLTGTGSVVTAPINLPAGSYRMTWTAQGHDNFIVNLHWSDGQSNLINEIPPDPANGEALVTSGGGRHFLEIEGATLSWTITFTKL